MAVTKSSRPMIAAMLFGAILSSGCGTIRGPNLFNPGPVESQKFWAQIFDPFPEDDYAPSISGGRPIDYDRAPPVVDRARNFKRQPSR
jgi:hypothetical protein